MLSLLPPVVQPAWLGSVDALPLLSIEHHLLHTVFDAGLASCYAARWLGSPISLLLLLSVFSPHKKALS